MSRQRPSLYWTCARNYAGHGASVIARRQRCGCRPMAGSPEANLVTPRHATDPRPLADPTARLPGRVRSFAADREGMLFPHKHPLLGPPTGARMQVRPAASGRRHQGSERHVGVGTTPRLEFTAVVASSRIPLTCRAATWRTRRLAIPANCCRWPRAASWHLVEPFQHMKRQGGRYRKVGTPR